MICRNCLRAASRTRLPTPTARFLSTSSPFSNASPVSATQATKGSSPPLQPSTPATPSSPTANPAAKKDIDAAAAPEKKAHPLVRSSIPAGTPLKGLNFLKNAQDPVAKEDSEYPEWLWTILDRQEKKADAVAAGDLFSKSKKQRRLAAKRLRKEQLLNPPVPKVPLYEQTIDLPAGDGSLDANVKAGDARDELTKAMRNKRRGAIKEANFLKAMG